MGQSTTKEKSSCEKDSDKKQVFFREGSFHTSASAQNDSYLIGTRCKECGYVFFPKRVVCPSCVKEDTLEEARLSKKGTIHSYSVLHTSLPGFPAPYILAVVEMPEGPRITSLITECEAREGALEIGTEVELVVGRITEDEDGNEVIGYMFRPVNRYKKERRL